MRKESKLRDSGAETSDDMSPIDRTGQKCINLHWAVAFYAIQNAKWKSRTHSLRTTQSSRKVIKITIDGERRGGDAAPLPEELNLARILKGPIVPRPFRLLWFQVSLNTDYDGRFESFLAVPLIKFRSILYIPGRSKIKTKPKTFHLPKLSAIRRTNNEA